MEVISKAIRQHIDDDVLRDILSNGQSSSRAADLAFVLHDAILKSPCYIYSDMLMVFNGRFYETFSKKRFTSVVFDLLREMEVPKTDILERGTKIMNVAYRALGKKDFVYQPHKMGFTNGVYNISEDSFSDFSPEHFIVSCVDYPYEGDKRGAENGYLWHLFLDEVLPEPHSQKMLQEFLGMLFLDRRQIKLDYMLFLLGKGKNGKSVIFHTINGILGESNITNYDISALISSRDKLKNIAEINGRRLNYCSDISSSTINTEAFKSLVSGEPQPARRIWGEPFIAYDIPFIIGNGNKMPSTTDFSDGFFRRILILPFNIIIPEAKQNKELPYLLQAEYPYIFNWIIEGRKRIIAKNYRITLSQESDRAINQYKQEVNNIFKWASDNDFTWVNHSLSLKRWVKSSYLYADYKAWCGEYDEVAYSPQRWGRFMSECGFEKRRFKDGQAYCLFGLSDNKYNKGVLHEEMPDFIIEKTQLKNKIDGKDSD